MAHKRQLHFDLENVTDLADADRVDQRRPLGRQLIPVLAIVGTIVLLRLAPAPGPGLVPSSSSGVAPGGLPVVGLVEAPRPLVVVLNASGSMGEEVSAATNVGAKWDVAVATLTQLVASLPEGAVVGVRVLGCSSVRCADSFLLRTPAVLGPDGAGQIQAQLSDLRPTGQGSLSQAVRAAADDLGAHGGDIVVVTDRLGACDDQSELCAAAEVVATHNDAVRISVVYVSASTHQRRAIDCISVATGGIGFDLFRPEPGVISPLLNGAIPTGLVTAVLLIAFGSLTMFGLGDLLSSVLGKVMVQGTAGACADIVFGLFVAAWGVFWLTRLRQFPTILAAVLLSALGAYLYRQLARRGSVMLPELR